MVDPRIVEVIDAIGVGVRSDGGDLEVTGVTDGAIQLKYTVKPGACRECLLPPEQLSLLLRAALEDEVPEVRELQITLVDDDGGDTPLGG